ARRGARAARARRLPRRLAGVARLITSGENGKLRLVRKLHDGTWRGTLGLFAAEGEVLVGAASRGRPGPVRLLVGAAPGGAGCARRSRRPAAGRAAALGPHDLRPRRRTRRPSGRSARAV